MYKDIVIVSAVRTPFGRYCGALKEYDYFDLGALPMRAVLERVGVSGDHVDDRAVSKSLFHVVVFAELSAG